MVGWKSLIHQCIGIIIWTNCFVNGIFHKLLEMFKDLRVPNKILKGLKQQGNFSPIQAMKITCPWKISNQAWFICHDFPGFFFSCQSLAAWLWHHLSSDTNQTMSMDDQDKDILLLELNLCALHPILTVSLMYLWKLLLLPSSYYQCGVLCTEWMIDCMVWKLYVLLITLGFLVYQSCLSLFFTELLFLQISFGFLACLFLDAFLQSFAYIKKKSR